MTRTARKHCICKHSGQDKLHGKGIRVHNEMKKREGWRCTVCGKEKT